MLEQPEGQDLGDARLALGQRASLVEGNGAHAADGFQRVATLDQQAPSRGHRKARGDGRRCGEHQRTWAGNQQQCEAAVQPGTPVATHGKWRNHHDQRRDGHDGRGVVAAELFDEASRGRLGGLRLLHQLDDARNGVVRCRLLDLYFEHAIDVDGAGEHVGTDSLLTRYGLAGDRRLVQAAFTAEDLAVRRHPVTRAHQHAVAHAQGSGGHFALPARGIEQYRRLRHQGGQRLDAGARAAGGHAFQQLADREQEHHGSSFLGLAYHERAQRGDDHQRFDRERRA